MRIAMLTGGGDCPGLNAVMRAVARKGERIHGDQLLGFRDGWRGVLDDDAVVGVPKTIDNDLSATELTFGFNTAVQICVDAIDRLHTTAESHDRVMVVEVMGRHAGHIALWAGIAGGATMVLIPEVPFDVDEVCAAIMHRHETRC